MVDRLRGEFSSEIAERIRVVIAFTPRGTELALASGMNRIIKIFIAGLFVVGVGACGGNGGEPDLDNYDARCVAACTDKSDTSVEGAGAICNSESKTLCLEECEARIEGTSTTCATCLVEDSCFGINGCSGPDVYANCVGNSSGITCTLMGPEGSCTYPQGDIAKEEACLKQVDPRREVTCEARFQPATACATLCD
ncbi:MAG: hypothetical protein AB7O24_31825 [Kofleriaceae bacterium]